MSLALMRLILVIVVDSGGVEHELTSEMASAVTQGTNDLSGLVLMPGV